MKRLSIFLLLTPLFSFTQEADFQIWSKASFGYTYNKQFDVKLTHGLRFRENASFLNKSYSNLRLGYRLNKTIRFGSGYRFSQVFDLAQQSDLRHRFYFDLTLREKIKRLRLNYRSRVYRQTGINHLESYYRGRISTSYNIKKTPLEPEFAIEFFYDLYAKRVDKARYTLGINYPLSKALAMNLFYRLQLDKNIPIPNGKRTDEENLYILGLGLDYTL